MITFDPHPRTVLSKNPNAVQLLSSTREKIRYCAEAGIDHLVIVPFTLDFSRQTPKEYIDNFLVRYFQPDRIVIGYDHRFGKDRIGDIEYLAHHGHKHGYEVIEIGAQEVNDITVSSTLIRKAVLEGNVRKAADLLGRPYEPAQAHPRQRHLRRTRLHR